MSPQMSHLSRLSVFLPRNPRLPPVAKFPASCSAAAYASSSSKTTLDGHKSHHPSSVADLVIFDAPSQPSDNHARRSARSPYSLSEYYNARRQIASRSPTQVRSTTSTSTSPSTSLLNSVSHPTNQYARTFDSPSKPREYYARPQRKRDLPELRSRLPLIALLGALGLSAWGAFVLYATNLERLSSSVVRQLSSNVKSTASVKEVLGDGVKPEGKWWLGGEPWIKGAVNMLQGNVDVSFRVRGSKGAGTLYFTSVREEKGQPFTILRSKIICDDGVVIQLLDI